MHLKTGSACGVWAYGWVKSTAGNVPVTLRLRNQSGDLSGSQTVVTLPETKQANFAEYIDFASSGSGVWVTPSGQWSLPNNSDIGDHVGEHAGSYQIAVSNPNEQDSNIADYAFECAPPIGVLNPDIANNSGDLVTPDSTSGVGLLIPAVQSVPDLPDTPKSDQDQPIIVPPIPAPKPEIQAADPIEPEEPKPEVSVCKNGRISGGKCHCPTGWDRNKISRFEFVCKKPAPQISCGGGSVANGKCLCKQGWKLQKLGTHKFRCLKPQPKIRCDNGKVSGGKCRCPQGWKLSRLKKNAFQCNKPARKINCTNGRVSNNKCLCPNGWKLRKLKTAKFLCVKPELKLKLRKAVKCVGGVVHGGKCRCATPKKPVNGVCVRPEG